MELDVRKMFEGAITTYRFASGEGGLHRLHTTKAVGVNVEFNGDDSRCPNTHIKISDIPNLIKALKIIYSNAEDAYKESP